MYFYYTRKIKDFILAARSDTGTRGGVDAFHGFSGTASTNLPLIKAFLGKERDRASASYS